MISFKNGKMQKSPDDPEKKAEDLLNRRGVLGENAPEEVNRLMLFLLGLMCASFFVAIILRYTGIISGLWMNVIIAGAIAVVFLVYFLYRRKKEGKSRRK